MAKTINVTSFENPHKFWILEKENERKRNEFQEFLNGKVFENAVETKPYLSMACIAFHKSSFKRGVIKDIKNNILSVWLVDYGITIETTKIFKISDELLIHEPFTKHACLINIIPTTSRLHFEQFTLSIENVDTFTAGGIKTAKVHLENAEKITFLLTNVYKGINCGEVFLFKNGKEYSLSSLLIDTKHASINEEIFKKTLDKMAITSPEEIIKEMGFEDDEGPSESYGRADSRIQDFFEQEQQQQDLVEDDFDDDASPILDSSESKSDNNLKDDSSSCVSLYSDAQSDKVSSECETKGFDVWAHTRTKKRKDINLQPADMLMSPRSRNIRKIVHIPDNEVVKENEEVKVDEKNKTCSNKAEDFEMGCQCENCIMWRTNDFTGQKLIFEPKKDPRPIIKPKLIFKRNEENASTLKIHSISNTYRQITPSVLAHGYVVPPPIQSVAKAPFNDKVNKILQLLNFKKPKPVQTYAWPAIMRRINVFIANAASTGKTMAYIPPLIAFITEKNERYTNLPPDKSPIVLIVCSNCTTADSIHALLTDIFHRVDRSIRVCLAIPPIDKHAYNQLETPVDILVTTPLSLLFLLDKLVINMKRVCHLVFENIDELLEKLSKEIYILLNALDSMLQHRNNGYPVQLIFTAERWTTKIKDLFSKLVSLPLICIGQPIEAAVYGKPELQMHFTSSQRKRIGLANILQQKHNYYKTLIVCDKESEIDEIEKYLVAEGKSMLILKQSMSVEMIKEYETIWKITKNDLLYICTDEFLKCYLNITDVGCLIHYNLPKDSWTTFCKRFVTVIDNYTSPFVDNKNTPISQIHVFIDESCENEFPKLQNFLLNICPNLPASFKEKCLKIHDHSEANKIKEKIELCSKLKVFGDCETFNCTKRHHLDVNLDGTTLPTSGTIHFRIAHIVDVSIFGAHLIEHIDLKTGQSTKIDNHCKEIEKELLVTCSNCKISPTTIKLKKWYVWEESLNEFRRVEVLAIVEEHKLTKQPNKVQIELVDYGRIETVRTSQLYELPEKLRGIPKQAIMIHLANILPPEKDLKWRKNLKNRIKDLFEKNLYDDEDCYFSSKILLTLGDTIWVKDVYLKETLNVTKVTVTRVLLKEVLIKRHYGIYTEGPLQKLYTLCDQFGIELPDFEVKTPCNVKLLQVSPRWAFLENKEYNEVYFSSAFTSDKFYVKLSKFEDIFRRFQKEIQADIQKPFYRTEYTVEKGKYYLAKDPEGPDYGRVEVIDIKDEEVNCLFVDFGDTAWVKKSDLKYLTDDQINKLPFQAIECSLYGISSISDDLEDEILDVLYNYAFEPKTEYFRKLIVKIMETRREANRNTYSVVLCDNFNDKTVNINKLVVESGLAHCINESLLKLTIDVPKSAPEQKEEEEEEEYEEVRNNQVESLLFDDFLDDDNWDIEISQPEEMCRLMRIRITTEPIKTTEESKNNNQNDSFGVSPVVASNETTSKDSVESSYSPDVLWHQSENTIKMEILLADVVDYTIKLLRGNIFYFKTTLNTKDYQVNITLYDHLEKTFQHVVFGQYIRVTMKKIKNEMWPRLTISTQKLRNVRYDYKKDLEIEPKPKPFLTIDVEASDDEDLVRYEIGSDVDYSESDIASSSDEF